LYKLHASGTATCAATRRHNDIVNRAVISRSSLSDIPSPFLDHIPASLSLFPLSRRLYNFTAPRKPAKDGKVWNRYALQRLITEETFQS